MDKLKVYLDKKSHRLQQHPQPHPPPHDRTLEKIKQKMLNSDPYPHYERGDQRGEKRGHKEKGRSYCDERGDEERKVKMNPTPSKSKSNRKSKPTNTMHHNQSNTHNNNSAGFVNNKSKQPHNSSWKKLKSYSSEPKTPLVAQSHSNNYSHSVCKIINAYRSNNSHNHSSYLESIKAKDPSLSILNPLAVSSSSRNRNRKDNNAGKYRSYSSSSAQFHALQQQKEAVTKNDVFIRSHNTSKKNADDLGEGRGQITKKRSKSAKEDKGRQSTQQAGAASRNHNYYSQLIEESSSAKNDPLKSSSKTHNSQHLHSKKKSTSISNTKISSSLQQNPNKKSKKITNSNSSIHHNHEGHNEYQRVFDVAVRTRKGVQAHNPGKVNQDRYVAVDGLRLPESVQKQEDPKSGNQYRIYAVADGHGPLGHYVSHTISESLPKRILHHLSLRRSPSLSLSKSYVDIQKVLQSPNCDFNAQFSGSTLVTLIIQNDKKITCANVGDSRAIVARQINKNNWEVIRLSDDHKPNREDERRRIIDAGGRIEKVRDEDGCAIGPWRVWLPKKQIQGLAMSRSLGDNVSKPIGVTHEPQIFTHELDPRDKFMLIASDGVWQFLTNYQILTLIIPFYKSGKLEDAADALLKAAYQSWTVDDCSVVDDITFLLVFLRNVQRDDKDEGEGQNGGVKKELIEKEKSEAEKEDASDAKDMQIEITKIEISKSNENKEQILALNSAYLPKVQSQAFQKEEEPFSSQIQPLP